MQCLAEEAPTDVFDQAGSPYYFSKNSVGITAIPAKAGDHFTHFMKIHHNPTLLSSKHLKRVKERCVDGLERQKKNPQTKITQELCNLFMRRTSERFTTDEAITHVQNISLHDVQSSLDTFYRQTHTFVAMPSRKVASSSEIPPPAFIAPPQEPYHEPLRDSRRIDIEHAQNQSIVCLARPGLFETTDPRYEQCAGLLYHIVFNSLGSRLFKMRQNGGLFYGANGCFGLDADPTHVGYDQICMKVNPCDVDTAIVKVKAMFSDLEKHPNITQSELDAAIELSQNGWVGSLASVELSCNAIETTMRHHPDQTWQSYPDMSMARLRAVSLDNINALARQVFAHPWPVTIVCGVKSS
jgi:predicted Zn-dependent peptidase